MKRWFGLLLALLSFTCSRTTYAHGMRTAYVEIVEHAPGQALVRFRATVNSPAAPVFPAGCSVKEAGQDAPADTPSGNSLARNGATYLVHCNGPLAGRDFSITHIGTDLSEAVVWISQPDGTTSSHLLVPAAPGIKIPVHRNARAMFLDYFPLGVEHIFTGADHLLFLLLLVLLLRRPKPVLVAETAFTLSHGLSFSAAALGWIHVSRQATEACIAMSLLFLALDVERRESKPPSANSVAALALVFGLVHGLGFAGGMTELGMPEQHVGWALLGFGLGVEAGQVAFLAIALVLAHFLLRSRFSFRATIVLTYLAGGLAAYWFLDRVRDCFGWRIS